MLRGKGTLKEVYPQDHSSKQAAIQRKLSTYASKSTAKYNAKKHDSRADRRRAGEGTVR